MVAANAAMRFGSRDGVKYVVVPPDLAVVARPVPSRPNGQVTPLTAAEARARRPGAAAVIDGPMFEKCAGEPDSYARYQCAQLDYRLLDRAAGIDVPGRYPTRGMTLSIVDGRPVVLDGSNTPPGAGFAVQLYPPLVRGSRNVATAALNRSQVYRAGIGVLPDGSIVLAEGSMSMYQFAETLRALGVVDAGYTDGGGSARIELQDGERAGSSENRRVASFIAAARQWLAGEPPPGYGTSPVPAATPAPTELGEGGGSSPRATSHFLGWMVAAAGALGLAWLLREYEP